jgi:hypothetical protein
MTHSLPGRLLLVLTLAIAVHQSAAAVPIRLTLSPSSELDVSLTLVGAINSTDADASQITGYFDAEIDFDSQGRPIASRIVTADLNASEVSLSLPLGFLLGSLDVEASGLHLTAYTPDAPPNPPVDPLTGAFDLDLHRFRLDAGTATASSFFYNGEFDFAEVPEEFTPLDGMQGTLTQTAGPGGGPVILETPIALSEFVTTIDLGALGTVDVFIDLNGTLVAEGLYDPPTVPGDTDGNGTVDLEDLNNVRNNFGGTGLGDTNSDGLVDLEDLNAVRNNFGSGGSPVPEPGAFALLAIGLLGSFYRLRASRIPAE